MSKKFLIAVIVIILGFAGYLVFFSKSDAPKDSDNTSDPKELTADDYLVGSPDKKVVVMEYLDFQCPGCGSLYPAMEAARQKYGGQATFVVRHFPLNSIHQNALTSARAAEAAGMQGKFFEMEAQLFPSQNLWKNQNTATAQTTFEGFAEKIGLDMERFKTDFVAAATLERINADKEKGTKMGVNSTPTVFINGNKIEINSEEDLNKAIEKAITEAGLTPPSAEQAQ